SWWRVVVLIAVAAAVMLWTSADADAQCSMCRAALTNAANSRLVRHLNMGVLVLLAPPLAIFCTLFIVLKRGSRE
ncbi:MAG TPA: hypothetical protein VFY60_06590, partial [Pyrinomonadaceae bacterium]|nr:hypothetical protein [Pyrinomonadaceae bacterium]